MPAQLHRAPPYLFWGLALSLLFHGGLALLLSLPGLAPRLLPPAPITMTIVPRRAEGALRTGDRTTAILQIKMAIAADPRSALLRAALAELMQQQPR